jgi:small nuclear ribonucleoprotein (snRNP)-like protein
MDNLLTNFLTYRVGTELVIRLKWGQTEYKGTLESIDSYMNVLLRDTEEYIDGKHTGTLGLVLIRCVQFSLGYVLGIGLWKWCRILVY